MTRKRNIISGSELMAMKSRIKDPPVQNRYTPQSMEVHRTFGDWSVTQGGDMSFKLGRYFIDRERLTEDEWICHLFAKAWINWNEFIPAYYTACKINNIEHVKMRIFYPSARNM